MNSPYEAPKAQVVSTPDGLKDGSVFGAVAAGFVVDIAGTIVVTAVLAALYGVYLVSAGTPVDEAGQILATRNYLAPHVLVAQFFGLLMSYLAGRLCCRIAGLNAKRAVVILASLVIAFGVLLDSGNSLAGHALMVAIAIGAYYAAWRSFLAANRQPATQPE